MYADRVKSFALATILNASLLTATSGCDRPASPSGGAPGSAGSSSGPRTRAEAEAERRKLKDEVRKEVEAELRESLTRELRPKIRAEVERELAGRVASVGKPVGPDAVHVNQGNHGVPPIATATAPDAASGDASPTPTDVAADGGAGGNGPSEPASSNGTAGNDGDHDDPWTTPGPKIWPWRSGFRLVDVEVGTGLEDKTPTDVRLAYDTVPELFYCYTVFENPGAEATVTHVWRRGTRLVSRVELEVGSSPKWKTWSKQRTQSHWTGTWSCEVLGPDGQQLGLTVFRVGPQAANP